MNNNCEIVQSVIDCRLAIDEYVEISQKLAEHLSEQQKIAKSEQN